MLDIERIRKEKGISIDEMEGIISRRTYYRVIKGEIKCTIDTLRKLAKLFDMSVEDTEMALMEKVE